MIGERIRQRRLSLGLSLQGLADKLLSLGRSLSRAALSKYELNQSTPNALVIKDLAKVLEVRTDFFFQSVTTEVQWRAFRKKASVSQNRQNSVKAQGESLLDQYLMIEDACGGTSRESKLLKVQAFSALENVETRAQELRVEWGVGSCPLQSLAGLFESKGIILLPIKGGYVGFDALSGTLSDGRAVMLFDVTKSVDRIRYNLAHELGHLIAKADSDSLDERIAHRFAGAFLIPADAMRSELGVQRNNLSIPELCLLKWKYGISIQALTYRAKDLGIISEGAYVSMFRFFRSRGIHETEPGSCPFVEAPMALRQMLFRAVAEKRLSELNAQELYPEYLEAKTEMETLRTNSARDFLALNPEERDRRLLEAADAAAGFYRSDGPLNDESMLDDVLEYE
jgi:Zn-dependent peptidase ImmA (M78 family)/transcriptional regulator with XRE-family HTH domain